MKKTSKGMVRVRTHKMITSKAYNLALARELTAGYKVTPDEKKELSRIYSKDDDRAVGEEIYKLRVMGKSKFEICKILSVDQRTVDRIYGTLTYSEYFKLKIDDALALMRPDGGVVDEAEVEVVENVKGMDDETFKEHQKAKLRDKLNKLLTGITPDKIYDAGVKEIGDTYQKLHAAYRLEQGKSTQNLQVGGVIAHTKMNKETYREIGGDVKKLGKQLLEIDGAIKRLESGDEKRK